MAAELFERTREELVAQFGAVTFSPQTLLGIWAHEDARYEVKLLKTIVDVDDLPEHRQYFAALKETLLERFEQEVYIASFPLEIL